MYLGGFRRESEDAVLFEAGAGVRPKTGELLLAVLNIEVVVVDAEGGLSDPERCRDGVEKRDMSIRRE